MRNRMVQKRMFTDYKAVSLPAVIKWFLVGMTQAADDAGEVTGEVEWLTENVPAEAGQTEEQVTEWLRVLTLKGFLSTPEYVNERPLIRIIDWNNRNGYTFQYVPKDKVQKWRWREEFAPVQLVQEEEDVRPEQSDRRDGPGRSAGPGGSDTGDEAEAEVEAAEEEVSTQPRPLKRKVSKNETQASRAGQVPGADSGVRREARTDESACVGQDHQKARKPLKTSDPRPSKATATKIAQRRNESRLRPKVDRDWGPKVREKVMKAQAWRETEPETCDHGYPINRPGCSFCRPAQKKTKTLTRLRK